MIEACKALNYAHNLENPETGHSLHIVHRDISPPNILISKMGEIKVVDFGLAKANSQIESTDPGVVKGKFSYLSPEAASGQEVDQRADIFAIGILLWEMFTGRRLFYGDTDYQTVELVRQARVPSIAALNPEIEPELEQVVRKALARNPDERYFEAADLGDALSQYLFSRRMKVTARDIGALVRDTQIEQDRKRSLAPKDSLIDNLIQDEMAKVTSLIEGESPALAQNAGSASLDPDSFIDTSAWVSDMGFDDHAFGSRAPSASPVPTRLPTAQPSRPPTAIPEMLEPAPPGEVEPLQQMLEPDRTGVHERESNRGVMIAVVVLLVLLALVGGTLAVFKDRIFGADDLVGPDRVADLSTAVVDPSTD